MIQELLGAVVEERKLNNVPTSFLVDVTSGPTSTSSISSSPSQSSASSENLRCPRCDSSHTKFCYYNNYNLTQPRHFCKTCRRYWTKGGALRNVPIGGGCRKTKAPAAPARPAAAPARADAVLPSSPLLWASCSIPHSSHLLALLRASQAQQGPGHNLLNHYCVKEAPMAMSMTGSDPLANLCTTTTNSNNSSMQQYYYHQQQPENLFLADAPTSSGIQELYQRLRAPPNCGGSNEDDQHAMTMLGNNGTNNVATATTTSTAPAASVMEPVPSMSGPGEFGYWNPGLPWADLSMANGAFPLNYI